MSKPWNKDFSAEGLRQLMEDEGRHADPRIIERREGEETYYTIGYGHRLDDSQRAKDAFKEAWNAYRKENPKEKMGWEEKRAKLYKGEGTLPEEVVDKLLEVDILRKIKTAKKVFGEGVFNAWPQALKDAVINGVFRGEYKVGHDTVKYMKEGDWFAAAEEYLNRDDYREAAQKNMSGIRRRMERNQAVMLWMGEIAVAKERASRQSDSYGEDAHQLPVQPEAVPDGRSARNQSVDGFSQFLAMHEELTEEQMGELNDFLGRFQGARPTFFTKRRGEEVVTTSEDWPIGETGWEL
jgi:hypothetical protein